MRYLFLKTVVFMFLLGACTNSERQTAPSVPARTDTSNTGAKPAAALAAVKSIPLESLRVPEDAQKTPDGTPTLRIRAGTGNYHPTDDDAVVLYSQVYDSSGKVVASGQSLIGDPAADLTSIGREAVHMMVEGEVRRFWFPDPTTSGGVKVTDFELVWISPRPEATHTP